VIAIQAITLPSIASRVRDQARLARRKRKHAEGMISTMMSRAAPRAGPAMA